MVDFMNWHALWDFYWSVGLGAYVLYFLKFVYFSLKDNQKKADNAIVLGLISGVIWPFLIGDRIYAAFKRNGLF